MEDGQGADEVTRGEKYSHIGKMRDIVREIE
jgi:hypothetical protein